MLVDALGNNGEKNGTFGLIILLLLLLLLPFESYWDDVDDEENDGRCRIRDDRG